ncbi:hypothetical protein TNCT_81651 [Trichonephila clavata]|uniref:Ubiquitin-like protease family profile domain-containing protein n=1 Tax=Trichonephila clavata TaxID=2740835 RepID=A0A8X6LV37_TRICU|nr:hypothetical protein TNCT_81651 [Trichonephila clavata]
MESISCRSIRFGSYKVFPLDNKRYLTVYLSPDSIMFCAPNVSGYFPLHEIVIKCNDMEKMIWCLKEKAVLFILPKAAFAVEVRDSLGIDKTCFFSFDPFKKDLRSLFITFNISFLTQEQINFIRDHYLPIETCCEINEQGCKQFMLMTAPVLTSQFVRICLSDDDPSTVWEEGTDVGLSASAKEVKVVSYRSKSRSGELPLTNIDIMCLNNGNWLNDNVINFYLEYMYSNDLTESEREKTHLFNSFFFSCLTRKRQGDTPTTKEGRHALVKTWTRKVDLFSKDYIVIPIHSHHHWYLVIACFPSNVTEGDSQSSESMVENSASGSNFDGSQRQMPCICIFNSVYNRAQAERTGEIVRDYLEVEYLIKKKVNKSFKSMKIFAMCCPQQPNSYDCGVYVFKNFQCFFKHPAIKLDDPMPNLEHWYHPACIFKKRQEIFRIIFDSKQQYKATPTIF